MKKCFINGIGSISHQNTHEFEFLDGISISSEENVLKANQPSYKDMIPPAMIRRMAKGVKMGIYASTKALNDAKIEVPDSIVSGTGMGCVEDSEKFLKAIIDNNEEFLTPTSFIQSTHNTVGAQIALGLGCKGYNFTYVNGAISFESALLDAKMQLDLNEIQSALVGGIDEMSQHTIDLYKLVQIIKSDTDKPFDILNKKSKGIVFGEGANFFVLENEPKENTYGILKDVEFVNHLERNEISDYIHSFLSSNNLTVTDLDVVVLGINGDSSDDEIYNSLAEGIFNETSQVYYKHLTGEFNTATSFAFWLTCQLLKKQNIPSVIQLNSLQPKKINNVLIYNHYQGKEHSFTLIQNV